MAINPGYIEIDEIVENVYRRAGVDTLDIDVVLASILELFGILGVQSLYVDRETNGVNGNTLPIEISSYRGILPNDLVYITNVREMSTLAKVSLATSDFEFDYNLPYDTDTTVKADVNSFNYKVEGNVIKTNVTDCKLIVSYKAILTSSKGYPMIPDDEKIKRAIRDFIIEQLDYTKWRVGEIPDKVYYKSELNKDRSIASARSKANTPSEEEMVNIARIWQRLTNNLGSIESGFNNIGIPEQIHTNKNKSRL